MSARTHSAEYKAASRARKIAAGICTGCSRKAVEGYRKCAVCLGWPNGEKPQRSYPVRKKTLSGAATHSKRRINTDAAQVCVETDWQGNREQLPARADSWVRPAQNFNPVGAAAWKAVYAARIA